MELSTIGSSSLGTVKKSMSSLSCGFSAGVAASDSGDESSLYVLLAVGLASVGILKGLVDLDRFPLGERLDPLDLLDAADPWLSLIVVPEKKDLDVADLLLFTDFGDFMLPRRLLRGLIMAERGVRRLIVDFGEVGSSLSVLLLLDVDLLRPLREGDKLRLYRGRNGDTRKSLLASSCSKWLCSGEAQCSFAQSLSSTPAALKMSWFLKESGINSS